MCAMDSLIRTCVWVLLVNGIYGRSLLSNNETSNSTDDYLNGELQVDSDCNWRYYQHYQIKGCQVNQVDIRGCPISYSCPSPTNVSFSEPKVCVYQNVEYQVGDKIEVNDKCKVCRCYGGDESRIACRQRECPQMQPVDGQNCHLVYEKNKCCPTRYECETYTEEINSFVGTEFACTYDGDNYPLGSKIYPLEDVCLVCECTETWNGVDNSSCYQQECVLEKNKHNLDAGCTPVYHENKCCPVEYYCPTILGDSYILPETSSIQNEDASEIGSSCSFGGKWYAIGTDIPVKNPCITCSCQVPPDFTCIHQSCPLEDCMPRYTADQCCPTYDCVDLDEGFETESNNESSQVFCPTPMCEDTCVVGVLPGEKCPTCICDDSPEKNDLEPILQELEPNYAEVESDTHPRDNEILSPLIPQNSSEREPLTQIIEENSIPKYASEHEEKERLELAPEMELDIKEEVLPKAEKSDEIKFDSVQEDTMPETHSEFTNSEDTMSQTHSEVTNSEDTMPQTHSEVTNSEDTMPETHSEVTNSEDTMPETHSEVINSEDTMPETHSEVTNSTGASNELRQKRSENMESGAMQTSDSQQQWNVYGQDQLSEETEDSDVNSERELEGNSEGFDEIKVFSTKNAVRKSLNELVELDEEEFENVIWTTEVSGCPSPMCADASCRIGIPQGHACPTCVCKKRRSRQP